MGGWAGTHGFGGSLFVVGAPGLLLFWLDDIKGLVRSSGQAVYIVAVVQACFAP